MRHGRASWSFQCLSTALGGHPLLLSGNAFRSHVLAASPARPGGEPCPACRRPCRGDSQGFLVAGCFTRVNPGADGSESWLNISLAHKRGQAPAVFVDLVGFQTRRRIIDADAWAWERLSSLSRVSSYPAMGDFKICAMSASMPLPACGFSDEPHDTPKFGLGAGVYREHPRGRRNTDP